MKTSKITQKSKTSEEFFAGIREHAKEPDNREKPPGKKRLGILKDSGFKLTAAFWEPLPEEELRLWEGEDD